MGAMGVCLRTTSLAIHLIVLSFNFQGAELGLMVVVRRLLAFWAARKQARACGPASAQVRRPTDRLIRQHQRRRLRERVQIQFAARSWCFSAGAATFFAPGEAGPLAGPGSHGSWVCAIARAPVE